MIDARQVQKVLRYMGYEIAVDGIWGVESQAALNDAASQYGADVPGKNVGNTGSWWDEIEYFKREEFRCPCGKCGGFPVEPDPRLVRFLDQKRKTVWKNNPITIVPLTGDPHAGGSGIRCRAYNDTLSGSSTNSRHLEGKAADIQVKGLSTGAVKMYLDQCVKAGEIRYTYICGGSVHLDVL